MEPPRDVAIFLNEAAGSATSGRVRRSIALVRERMAADLHVTATRDQETLQRWLAERMPGYRTAIVAGGDGSLAIALNVAAQLDVTVGYIPAGFGNAARHLLRLPSDPAAVTELLAASGARPIDLVRVDGRLALFAGAGWDAVVADRYARTGARRLAGWAAAVAASAGDLVQRRRVRVEADGRVVHAAPMELAVVGVTPYYGRGLVVNPGAHPARGELMLRVYPGPLPRFALEALRWVLHRDPAARGVAARRVTIDALDDQLIPVQADGDLIGERVHWEMELAPAAVRVIGRW